MICPRCRSSIPPREPLTPIPPPVQLKPIQMRQRATPWAIAVIAVCVAIPAACMGLVLLSWLSWLWLLPHESEVAEVPAEPEQPVVVQEQPQVSRPEFSPRIILAARTVIQRLANDQASGLLTVSSRSGRTTLSFQLGESITPDKGRDEAVWRDAITELTRGGLLERYFAGRIPADMERYRLTAKGYDLADEIGPESGK